MRLVGAGLEHHADALLALARPSLRLRSSAAADGDISLGASKLGGDPDLLIGTEWPVGIQGPLSFIAQVELPANPDRIDGNVPQVGLLSFFYDAEQQPWGFDPKDRGSWRLTFTSPGETLSRMTRPEALPPESVYKPCKLTPEPELTYVPSEQWDLDGLHLSTKEQLAYSECFDDQRSPIHRILGCADAIQGDMQLRSQLASNGVYVGGGDEDPREDALRRGAVDWRLLLQIDSDDHAGMEWGDTGRLFYWIRQQDLENGAWDSVWLILQSS